MRNHRSRARLRRALSAVLPDALFAVRETPLHPVIYLTFDDGPHPTHTPAVLRVLESANACATFFVVGRQAAAYPHLLRSIASAGHTVGNHSYSHAEPGRLSARWLFREIRATDHVIRRETSNGTRLFRPPKGRLTPLKLAAAWWAGQRVVLWTADPRDYACGSPRQLRAWFDTHPLSSGDIVLMHDTHGHAAAVLPEILARYAERGFRFAALGAGR